MLRLRKKKKKVTECGGVGLKSIKQKYKSVIAKGWD